MNQREAMQALLDGKRLTADTLVHGKYLEMRGNGMLYWDGGGRASLGAHDWKVYEEPNPHTPGTFAWAREEAKRGQRVRRAVMSRISFNAHNFEGNRAWALEHIDAKDWELA